MTWKHLCNWSGLKLVKNKLFERLRFEKRAPGHSALLAPSQPRECFSKFSHSGTQMALRRSPKGPNTACSVQFRIWREDSGGWKNEGQSQDAGSWDQVERPLLMDERTSQQPQHIYLYNQHQRLFTKNFKERVRFRTWRRCSLNKTLCFGGYMVIKRGGVYIFSGKAKSLCMSAPWAACSPHGALPNTWEAVTSS